MRAQFQIVVLVIALLLSGCSASLASTLDAATGTPSKTPAVPSQSATPSPNATDAHLNEIVTRAAALIPTPFPTAACSEAGFTQPAMNECAAYQREDMKKKMDLVVERILQNYPGSSEEATEFLRLQTEWEVLAKEECSHWWGQIYTNPDTGYLYYEHGTMAPLLVATCLTGKCSDRARELQLFLFYNGR